MLAAVYIDFPSNIQNKYKYQGGNIRIFNPNKCQCVFIILVENIRGTGVPINIIFPFMILPRRKLTDM